MRMVTCSRCGQPMSEKLVEIINGQIVCKHRNACNERAASVRLVTKPTNNKPAKQTKPIQFDDITSGLGIGGVGSDDFNLSTERDPMTSEYDRESHQPGEQVCPDGTTYGTRGGENDRCHCGRSGDWNPGAGQYLCERHWDEY